MHVVLVEPSFPKNQREFLRGLIATGASVSAISERPAEALPDELRRGLFGFQQVRSVVDEGALADAVRHLSAKRRVDQFRPMDQRQRRPCQPVDHFFSSRASALAVFAP